MLVNYKYKSGWTKTTHMLTGAVSKQTTDDLKEELSMTWYGIPTDGSNDENDKHLPILIRHVGKISGLIETSLLDIPNINSGSTTPQMFNVCNEVIENFSLEWNKCVTYSSDNTNSMAGCKNSLLKKIKDAQAEQKVFDVGCSCHLAHICAGKEARQFLVYIEDFVIDIFCHFQQSGKRKSQLRELMEFNNNEIERSSNTSALGG